MVRKKSYEEVALEFTKRGYTLLAKSYNNNKERMLFKCPDHPEEETKIDFSNLMKGQGCSYCAKERNKELGESRRFTKDEVNRIFEEKDCILISEYKNNKSSLIYICSCGSLNRTSLNNFKKSRGCRLCLYNRNSGEGHYKYNHNRSEEDRIYNRRYPEYKEWLISVFKRDNYTCQTCGDNSGGNLNAHHLDGYNWCIEGRVELENGITLCDICHTSFHREYGYGNNTRKQFEEWLERNSYKIKVGEWNG